MQKLSPDALSEQLRGDDEGPLVLDIRHEGEFEDWHIPGSVNVDVYDELTADPERAKPALSDLPMTRRSSPSAARASSRRRRRTSSASWATTR